MATRRRLDSADSIENIPEQSTQEDSSESEGETEPAKAFHRRISTNREIKTTRCIKEGYLMKQTSSFQRWRKRYFKLKGRKLYYAKDTKSLIFDEIELTDLSVAECSTKNVNHSFQVITPFRNLVLCADSRKDMEEWVLALKKAANREFYDPNADHRETLSGQHNWYSCSHARPTYCNVCREALSGVTSHGLSCEVCKFKVHKRCAVRARNNCKWTTLASVGKDIIEEEDGTISTPHQWIEGNLPVSAKCVVCDKTCGSVLRLQDWRCLWCRAMVHTGCREAFSKHCPLGQCRVSILPPIAIDNLDLDGYCEATKPAGTSPLLVFVNSKSGDNQGVKFLRRFKQLLNPAQVFDLINGGPHIGLRLFQKFDTFRILVCGGDGSIGWVLSEIDKLGLHKQCQVGVLPLGTGNDLSRVLGWGSSFDDDTQLPSVLERMEHAQIKMLDRWSIHIFEGSMPAPRKLSQQFDPISAYEDSVAAHLSKILQSDDHSVVISSAKVLCETVKDFVAKVGSAHHIEDSGDGEDSIGSKCARLNQKLDALLGALSDESQAAKPKREPALGSEAVPEVLEDLPSPSSQHKECQFKPTKQTEFKPREQLMSRANSLKKAIRQIIEHTERAVDEQNFQSLEPIGEPITENPPEPLSPRPPAPPPPTSQRPPSLQIPTITTETIDIPEVEDQDEEVAAALHSPVGITMGTSSNFLSVPVFTFTSPERDFGKPSPYGLMPIPSPPPTAARLGPEGRSRSPSPAPIRLPSPLPSPTSGDFSLPSSPGPLTPPFPVSGTPEALPSPTLMVPISSPSSPRPTTRRISSMSTFSKSVTFAPTASGTLVEKEEKKAKETKKEIHPLTSPTIMGLSSGLAGSLAGGSFISRVLLANADALCAAATPLIEEDISLEEYKERCVMNNYFGIGLDAKITLDFHIKREEHPEKCRSRTKNMMWYGVLGGKEILNRTFKNLDQRVQLECDGHRIPLPSLQGIVVLNIPSYMGGANFWGGTKQDDYFRSPSFDDKVLEVVAVFSGIQLGISNIFNLQRHRIAQCRSVKITIMGDEPVPVQVDGEAWMQLPGFIRIVHKNRAQMLTRDKVFEEALRTWTEKQRLERPVSPRHNVLSDDEISILHAFVDATEQLIKSVKVASISNSAVEQELFHLATQASSFLDRLYPAGKLLQPAIRTQVSDLVSSVRSLYKESQVFLADKASALHLRPDIEEGLITALANLDHEMKKVYEIGGLPHFHTIEEEIATSSESYSKRGKEKEKSGHKFRLMSKLMKSGKKEKERSPGPSAFNVHEWGTEEVAQWLDSLGLGEYREGFIRNDIRGPELLHLERRDLKDLGITKVGHLKRVQQGIKEVQSKMSALDKSATVL